MKNKVFLLLAIIAVVGIAFTFNYSKVWAQQEGPVFDSTKMQHIPVEFTPSADVDSAGSADPQQVIFTEVLDGPSFTFPRNTFDFGATGNVDALANIRDHQFHQLVKNRANLLLSVQFDTKDKAVWCVWMEDEQGGKSPKWKKTDLDANGLVLTPGADLDALEVWGPNYDSLPDVPPIRYPDDANCYSLQGDPLAGTPARNYSVFRWYGYPPSGPPAGRSIPYILRTDIWNAVRSAALDTSGTQGHFTGDSLLVDLDALMVWDGPADTASERDTLWNAGDTIIFSIRAAANWDGGEIVVLPFGGPPSYLNHGNHRWNTSFDVTLFGVDVQEVDAIEAYPVWFQQQTPTLTQWGVVILVALLVASTVFVMLKRRKSAVPA